MSDSVIDGGAKPTKIKAKVLDDIEDEELQKEKKEEEEVEEIPDVVDQYEEEIGSDYEDESDDEVELQDVNFHQKEEKENLYDTDYYRCIKVIPPEMRITSDIMTMFEFSEVIGVRTLQIEKGSPVFTDVEELNSPYDMAIKELFDRKSPLKIIRKISKFEQEEFTANEMGFPFDIRSSF